MFGYIRICKEELKIKEYTQFRAYYCGLCQELKKHSGQLSRLLLNYDLTFFGLFLASWDGSKVSMQKNRCLVHPLHPQLMVMDSPQLAYAADLNLLLAYHKLADDWQDDRKFTARTAMFLLGKAYRQARQRQPAADQLIKAGTAELNQLEKVNCPEIDRVADTFARILAGLIPVDPTRPAQSKAAVWLGYNLGKWIYLIDAYDDLDEDIRQRSYNPFIFGFAYAGEDIDTFRQRIKPEVEFLLTHTLSQVGASFDLLGVTMNLGILENIIYLGMLQQTEKVLNQRRTKGEKLLCRSWGQGKCHQGGNP